MIGSLRSTPRESALPRPRRLNLPGAFVFGGACKIYGCGRLLHACLQTSCWVVQLMAHDEAPAGLDAGPTQEFWQFMTCVSQPSRQAVDVCDDINGVGTTGIG